MAWDPNGTSAPRVPYSGNVPPALVPPSHEAAAIHRLAAAFERIAKVLERWEAKQHS